MTTSAANRVPDEIVSEILTPLLTHSDDVFRDQAQKPLLDPDHSASRYLLVSKSWLRVSTPLLYNVVILRTTAQAKALHAVLETNKGFGLFIQKLRVEGGFGNAMHAILESAPNITDLYLTLFIGGFDNVGGLCSGLTLINPRRVIVVDACDSLPVPKKNQKVTRLLEALVRLIPKWDKMHTFQFPYITLFGGSGESTKAPRAAALISALAKSSSLQTLIVGMGKSFPPYLRHMVDVPSLKRINFTVFEHVKYQSSFGLRSIRETVKKDPKLAALVTYNELEDFEHKMREAEKRRQNMAHSNDEDDENSSLRKSRQVRFRHRGKLIELGIDEHGNYLCPKESLARADSLPALKKVGETVGGTLKNLSAFFVGNSVEIDLTPFASLTYLDWGGVAEKCTISVLGPGSSALPFLEELRIGGEIPLLLEIVKLPLNCLRSVELLTNVPGAIAFVQCHGPKLEEFGAGPKIITETDVVSLCANLKTLNVRSDSLKESQVLPQNFLASSTPHASLAKIHFRGTTVSHSPTATKARKEVTAAIPVFEYLKPESFPALKVIQIDDIKWPTTEQQARKDPWVTLSEVLHQKGISLTDCNGVAGPTGARAKVSTLR
ncbi:hypothetical protein K438DRAFT_1674476 [Mycena galopus ATCC 62051]|nr:hypothetical protein K438DRAFT_1674476 [Mycena galopus ATCC 62051]